MHTQKSTAPKLSRAPTVGSAVLHSWGYIPLLKLVDRQVAEKVPYYTIPCFDGRRIILALTHIHPRTGHFFVIRARHALFSAPIAHGGIDQLQGFRFDIDNESNLLIGGRAGFR